MNEKFRIINNKFEYLEIQEDDGKFTNLFKLDCENKVLFIQNDINMQNVLKSSSLLLNLENLYRTRYGLDLLIKNAYSYGIYNPIVNFTLFFLSKVKLSIDEKKLKEINNYFFKLEKKAKDHIKYHLKRIKKFDDYLLIYETDMRKKFDINKKNFNSEIHHEILSNIAFNYKGFINLSILSTIEASLSHDKKLKYPEGIILYDDNLLYPKEEIIQDKIINYYLIEKHYHNFAVNYINYANLLARQRRQEYHLYNLLSFLIIYDFLIEFEDIKKISVENIENYINTLAELTIPALHIINGIKNYNSLFCRAENQKLPFKPKMDGFDFSGIKSEGGKVRYHKNTVFDLSEAIMSNLLYDKDYVYNIYLTKDRDSQLLFNLFDLKLNNNKISFEENDLLICNNIRNYKSVLTKVNQEILFENKIYKTTKNKMVYTNDDDFIKIIHNGKGKKDIVKNLCLNYFTLGHNKETIDIVWDKLQTEKYLKDNLEIKNCNSMLMNLYYYSIMPKKSLIIEQRISDILNCFNLMIIEILSEEVIKKRKILNLENLEQTSYIQEKAKKERKK